MYSVIFKEKRGTRSVEVTCRPELCDEIMSRLPLSMVLARGFEIIATCAVVRPSKAKYFLRGPGLWNSCAGATTTIYKYLALETCGVIVSGRVSWNHAQGCCCCFSHSAHWLPTQNVRGPEPGLPRVSPGCGHGGSLEGEPNRLQAGVMMPTSDPVGRQGAAGFASFASPTPLLRPPHNSSGDASTITLEIRFLF